MAGQHKRWCDVYQHRRGDRKDLFDNRDTRNEWKRIPSRLHKLTGIRHDDGGDIDRRQITCHHDEPDESDDCFGSDRYVQCGRQRHSRSHGSVAGQHEWRDNIHQHFWCDVDQLHGDDDVKRERLRLPGRLCEFAGDSHFQFSETDRAFIFRRC